MITKTQALTENHFHFGNCTRKIGKRGGVTEIVEHWRRNGATKIWKRSPERFSIPIKYGLRDYGYITEVNAGDFHVESECQLYRATAKLVAGSGTAMHAISEHERMAIANRIADGEAVTDAEFRAYQNQE